MECLRPFYKTIEQYRIVDGEKRKVLVRAPLPCGRCEVCLSKRRDDWFFRLKQEFKDSSHTLFVTLTYSDDNLTYQQYSDGSFLPIVVKDDVQKFLKRLRKSIEPFKIRYYCVAEYSPTKLRPHYHIIIFDYPENLSYERINKAWNKGFITVDVCNEARLNYCAKYVNKPSMLPWYLPRPFMLCSRHPAIGYGFLENADNIEFFCGETKRDSYIETYGEGKKKRVRLPRYYRDRLFSEEDKLNLSLEYFIKYVESQRAKGFDPLRTFGFADWTYGERERVSNRLSEAYDACDAQAIEYYSRLHSFLSNYDRKIKTKSKLDKG